MHQTLEKYVPIVDIQATLVATSVADHAFRVAVSLLPFRKRSTDKDRALRVRSTAVLKDLFGGSNVLRGGEDWLMLRLYADKHVREIGVLGVLQGYDPVKSSLDFPGGPYVGLSEESVAFVTGVVDFFFDGFAKRLRRRMRKTIE